MTCRFKHEPVKLKLTRRGFREGKRIEKTPKSAEGSPKMARIKHLALKVGDLEAATRF